MNPKVTSSFLMESTYTHQDGEDIMSLCVLSFAD